jgi:Flp pilus assembly protein TadD
MAVLICIPALLGCGPSKTIAPETAASAQASYDEAMAQIETKEYESAVAALDLALTPGGGLPADIYTNARIERAKCLARLERFDEAHADLEVASQGTISEAVVRAVRAFVYKCEGKDAEASKEMAAAKKIDRRIKTIR